MILNVFCDIRCVTTPDGTTWTTSPFDQHFWQRYLEPFDSIRVFARSAEGEQVATCARRVDAERIQVVRLPMYSSPWQFLSERRRLQTVIQTHCQRADAILFRIPSHVCNLVWRGTVRGGKPFGVEVTGDPYDVFAAGVGPRLLRKPLQIWSARSQQAQCRRATTAAYVTERYLQRRYPPSKDTFHTTYSSVDLDAALLSCQPRTLPHSYRRVVTVGSLDQLYKGTDTLIKAIAILAKADFCTELRIVGNGRFRQSLEQLASEHGISQQVTFVGEIPPKQVRAELEQADLFVLPSLTEGLPRAMIEALAAGLPCIGTTVGGIPELLPHELMVPPRSEALLANKIRQVLSSPDLYHTASATGPQTAARYTTEVLQIRRNSMYHRLRQETAAWLDARNAEHAIHGIA